MNLWIAMGVLAAIAALAVMFPLFRPIPMASGHRWAGAIYRDQLSELRRDVDDGRIAGAEAEAARVEIARRLIHAEADTQAAMSDDRSWRAISTALIIAAPVVALGIYLMTGSPNFPDAPLAARMIAPPDESDLGALVARTEAYLAENPDDGAGWEVIGPVYLRMGRYDEAAAAFARVIEQLGANVTREANLGEAITAANDGRVTDEAQAAFQRAIALEPGHDRSRFYLARGLEQGGHDAEAAVAWAELLADAPLGAPWAKVARVSLREANARLGIEGSSEPAPTSEDIAAAADMSAGDRLQMIEGMVANLADRLESEPDDPEGWARLIRSYIVLEKRREAQLALVDARSVLAAGSRGRELVDATAGELQLTTPEGAQ
jgi:cytochrome c-type biogenesis protein CcmH